LEKRFYQEYFFFEKDNWWFVARRRILLSLLRKHLPRRTGLAVLDAGCGTGINVQVLGEFGIVTGVDISAEAIAFCRTRGELSVVQGDLRALDLPDRQYDLVTALDVIEHIDADERAARELIRVTKPGGHILITVPAFPSLWSEHDEVNQHVRRYRAAQLRDLVARNGCTIRKFSYLNTVLFPVAVGARTAKKIRRRLLGPPNHPPRSDFVEYPALVNGLLTALFSAEAPLVMSVGLPFGLSLVCLAEKNGT